MRKLLIGLTLMFGVLGTTSAQLSVGISLPGVSIGINVPVYPQLVRVPGYPVYYAPQLNSNFFFYDNLYWAYEGDNWYRSDWYNGPWDQVYPQDVPLYVLRVPVRYYRAPPAHFRGWQTSAPPRWDQHWGPQWTQEHPNWNRWDRRNAPRPTPLPSWQRQYPGERYPQRVEQQRELRAQHERMPPRMQVPQRPAPPQRAAPPPVMRDMRPQPAAPQHPPMVAPRVNPGRDRNDGKHDDKRDDKRDHKNDKHDNNGNDGNNDRRRP